VLGSSPNRNTGSPEVFRGFLQSLQVDAAILPQLLLSKSSPTHYKLVILPFESAQFRY
jgi:hypothetical protein